MDHCLDVMESMDILSDNQGHAWDTRSDGALVCQSPARRHLPTWTTTHESGVNLGVHGVAGARGAKAQLGGAAGAVAGSVPGRRAPAQRPQADAVRAALPAAGHMQAHGMQAVMPHVQP